MRELGFIIASSSTKEWMFSDKTSRSKRDEFLSFMSKKYEPFGIRFSVKLSRYEAETHLEKRYWKVKKTWKFLSSRTPTTIAGCTKPIFSSMLISLKYFYFWSLHFSYPFKVMKVCEWEMRRQIRQGLKLMSSNFYDFFLIWAKLMPSMLNASNR